MVRSLYLSLDNASYQTKVRLTAGLLAGFISALSIIVVVTAGLVLTGSDIWTAARLIATSLFGDTAAGGGWLAVILGTLIHLLTGTLFGGLFAAFVPRLPANVYVVAGILYGLLVWIVMGLVVLPVSARLLVASSGNLIMLLFAHVIYGFVLGIAAGVIELMVAQPKAAISE